MRLQAIRFLALCLSAPASLATQVESLGALPGTRFQAEFISENGEVIVGQSVDTQHRNKVGVWTRSSGLNLLDSGTLDSCSPFAMSADGSTIAGDSIGFGPGAMRRPVIWELATGTRTDLGVLPGFSSATVQGMSADGTTVIGTCSLPASSNQQVFRWTAATGLQPLAPLTTFYPPWHGISADGTRIVGGISPTLGSFETRARIWSATGGLSPIPGLPDVNSFALGVSADGLSIVGRVTAPGFPSGIFYYQQGVGVFPVDLGGTPIPPTDPVLISADGSTVVAQVGVRAVKWSLGSGLQVLSLGGYSVPASVSADGSTVVGFNSSNASTTDGRAFRWESSGQVVILDSIQPGVFTGAAAISADGSVVAGSGFAAPLVLEAHGTRWNSDGEIGETYCGPSVPNSTNASAEMHLSGSNLIQRGDLLLRATGLPPLTFGIFLASQSRAFVTGIPGSQGNLCLGGGIGRFVGPGQLQQANASGEFSLVVDPSALPSPLGAFTPAAGQTVSFQAWYRDANPGSTSNFTSGASVPFF